jgi:hypothetical protein
MKTPQSNWFGTGRKADRRGKLGGMRRLTLAAAFIVIILGCLPLAAQTKFDHVEYLKSVQQAEKTKGEPVKGALFLDSAKKSIEFLDKDGATTFAIPNSAIRSLHYERTSRPRYAEGLLIAWPLLFTKSKKHYLTIQYTDAGGEGHFAILHLDKSNYQQILAATEAQTGLKVDREEEK